MMTNYDQSVETNHNPNWLYIPDHPHRILIGGSGSGNTNVLSNLIKFICTSNQIINCLLMEKKKQEIKH